MLVILISDVLDKNYSQIEEEKKTIFANVFYFFKLSGNGVHLSSCTFVLI